MWRAKNNDDIQQRHSMTSRHYVTVQYKTLWYVTGYFKNISVSVERGSDTTSIPVHDSDQGFCPYCRKFYQGNLRRHIKGVHFKVKPFKCEYCESRFSQKSDRFKHIKRIHGEGRLPFKYS